MTHRSRTKPASGFISRLHRRAQALRRSVVHTSGGSRDESIPLSGPRPSLRLPSLLVLLCLLTTFLTPPAALAGQLSFQLTDLGTLNGTTGWSQAYGINDQGDIVGESGDYWNFGHAVLWRRGVISDLGVLQTDYVQYGATDVIPSPYAVAHGINNASRIVGTTWVLSEDWEYRIPIPMVWNGGEWQPLSQSRAEAVDVNASGQAIGRRVLGYDSDTYSWAALWSDGTESFQEEFSMASAINDRGDIAGSHRIYDRTSEELGPHLPVVWRNGVPESLQGGSGHALGIGEDGNAVGILFDRGPVLWNDGLPTILAERADCAAVGVNDSRWVIGNCDRPSWGCYSSRYDEGCGTHPFLWTPEQGWIELQELLQDAGVAELLNVADINASGQIVGSAQVGDSLHAVLLTPVTIAEPSVPLLMSMVLVGVAFLPSRIAYPRR